VDALGGRPGIYSARYAGRYAGGDGEQYGKKSGTEYGEKYGSSVSPKYQGGKKLEAAERNALLLEELGEADNRKARFVCAMVLLLEPERFFMVQETLEGEIVRGISQTRGSGGFGYDPILFIPPLGRTAAELSETEKNDISHRGKAGRIIGKLLDSNSIITLSALHPRN
jgi:XTP/dITP diphosphohydrolase